MQRILVATDRSPSAARAVAWAADLARRTGSELILVQVAPDDESADVETL